MQSDTPKYETVYCLFVRVGREQYVAENTARWQGVIALSPVREKREHHRGKWIQRQIQMLPGYVFVYTPAGFDPEMLLTQDYTFKLLRYADGGRQLIGKDRIFADWVFEQGGLIGISRAFQVGERVTVYDGPLKSLEDQITSVNKRKQIARVDLEMCDAKTHVWLSFEWM